MTDTIIVYRSVQNAIAKMSDEEVGKFFRAYLAYGLDGEDLSLGDYPLAEVAMAMSKPLIDANNSRKELGKKGGRPSKKTMVFENEKGGFEDEKTMVFENENYGFENKKPTFSKNESNEDEDVDEDVDVNEDVDVDRGRRGKKKKPAKYAYGEYSHVLLSDDERTKLDEEFGSELTKRAIDYFDSYIEEKGYKCKSHYLAMRRWVFSAVREQDERVSKVKLIEKPETYEMNLGDGDDGLKYL